MGRDATLNHRGESIARLSVRQVNGRKAVDGATLVFACDLVAQRSRIRYELDRIQGWASVHPAGDIGPVWLIGSFRLQPSADDKTSLNVAASANSTTIRAIDKCRSVDPHDQVTFTLWLEVLGRADDEQVIAQGVVELSVSGGDWARVVAESGYEARHLIDVPISGPRIDGAYTLVGEHYRRALGLAKKSEYVQVLAECRKAMEALSEVTGRAPRLSGWDPATKEELAIAQRLDYVRSAVHEMFHSSAHAGVADDPTGREAELALALVGSLLRYYADR